jgi:hypothetical protein
MRSSVLPLKARDVGRDALPASVAKPPIIGVAAGPLGTICLQVAGAPVDDGEVAEDTDDHVVLADVLDRGAATDLRKKGLAAMKVPSGLVLKKSVARLASTQATSASSTERM